MADDTQVLEAIRRLVDEERDLRTRDPDGLDALERKRMEEVEAALDQCWDYLRQRRAARDHGRDPDQVRPRPPEVVDRYLQ